MKGDADAATAVYEVVDDPLLSSLSLSRELQAALLANEADLLNGWRCVVLLRLLALLLLLLLLLLCLAAHLPLYKVSHTQQLLALGLAGAQKQALLGTLLGELGGEPVPRGLGKLLFCQAREVKLVHRRVSRYGDRRWFKSYCWPNCFRLDGGFT